VAFAPNGLSLATAGDDQTVRLWGLTNPARPRPLGQALSGHTSAVSDVAFAPDGRSLATASGDQTVRLWDPAGPNADVNQPMQRACALTHHSIGADDWARLVTALPYRDACAS
jgi:WD40 repeat protein